jgi:hypothetical protein
LRSIKMSCSTSCQPICPLSVNGKPPSGACFYFLRHMSINNWYYIILH